MVGASRIELPTSSASRKRSPTELRAHKSTIIIDITALILSHFTRHEHVRQRISFICCQEVCLKRSFPATAVLMDIEYRPKRFRRQVPSRWILRLFVPRLSEDNNLHLPRSLN